MAKRKPKGENKKWYFGQATEDAIVEYNRAESMAEKNKIFKEKIYGPFCELVDNLIMVHRIKCLLETRENIRDECVSHLTQSLNRFDPELGKKAFSYYDVIAKHWLINFAKKQQRQLTEQKQILESEKTATRSINQGELTTNPMIYVEEECLEFDKQDLEELKERLEKARETINVTEDFFNPNRNKHGRSLWRTIGAVIYLLDSMDQIPTISKKTIRIYLKEISGLTTSQLSTSLKTIKPIYQQFLKEKIQEFNGYPIEEESDE